MYDLVRLMKISVNILVPDSDIHIIVTSEEFCSYTYNTED